MPAAASNIVIRLYHPNEMAAQVSRPYARHTKATKSRTAAIVVRESALFYCLMGPENGRAD